MNIAGFYARLAPSLVDIIELILIIAAVARIVFVKPDRGRATSQLNGFGSAERWLGRLARSKTLSVVMAGLLVDSRRVALIPVLGIPSYWRNGYWSGSVVALGGSLVLGSWPRIKKHARATDAILMAIGLAILANSRPYEGLLFSLPIAAAFAIWIFGRRRPAFSVSLGRVVLPMIVLLGAIAAGTGYYYWRVTGSPFRMTYQVNRGPYATAPYFLWQSPRPEPVYHHAVIRDFYRWELRRFEGYRTLGGAASRTWDKLAGSWKFYCGPLLTIPLLAFPWILHDRKMRFPIFAGAVFVVGLAGETWTMPHYVAPATGIN